MADAPDQTPERVAEIVYRTTMDREVRTELDR